MNIVFTPFINLSTPTSYNSSTVYSQVHLPVGRLWCWRSSQLHQSDSCEGGLCFCVTSLYPRHAWTRFSSFPRNQCWALSLQETEAVTLRLIRQTFSRTRSTGLDPEATRGWVTVEILHKPCWKSTGAVLWPTELADFNFRFSKHSRCYWTKCLKSPVFKQPA